MKKDFSLRDLENEKRKFTLGILKQLKENKYDIVQAIDEEIKRLTFLLDMDNDSDNKPNPKKDLFDEE